MQLSTFRPIVARNRAISRRGTMPRHPRTGSRNSDALLPQQFPNYIYEVNTANRLCDQQILRFRESTATQTCRLVDAANWKTPPDPRACFCVFSRLSAPESAIIPGLSTKLIRRSVVGLQDVNGKVLVVNEPCDRLDFEKHAGANPSST